MVSSIDHLHELAGPKEISVQRHITARLNLPLYLILGLFFSVVLCQAEEIYSEEITSEYRLILSLTPEQIAHQKSYDLKKESLPISLVEAGVIALSENKIHPAPRLQKTDLESVSLKQYRAPSGQSDHGKFFYLVTLRLVVNELNKDRWSYLTRWAIFPDGMIVPITAEAAKKPTS